MKNWLWSIPPHNYQKCVEHRVFAIRTAGRRAVESVKPGDRIFAYLPGLRAIAGLFTAASSHFESRDLIWDDGEYPHRVRVRPDVLLSEEHRLLLDEFKDRLAVGEPYPNFGLVIQKVVHELPGTDGDLLFELVQARRQAGTLPPEVPPPPAGPHPSPPPPDPTDQVQRLLRELHVANQRIGVLRRQVKDLEELLVLAGPNLEDYLRLAHSSQGAAFEEATRKCFEALGFSLDRDYQGQSGEIDFVTTHPYLVFAECQASEGANVGVTIVDKLLRHRRRYLNHKGLPALEGDCRIVVSEFATDQLVADAVTENVTIIKPSQIAALLKFKREYPGAMNPYNLRDLLETPGDATAHVIRFIDGLRDEIEQRVGIIEVLKNDRFARQGEVSGRDPGWIQARVEAELEIHVPLDDLTQILRELTSPLVGCVGFRPGQEGRLTYFYIRDYDFQLSSVGTHRTIAGEPHE
jgi:Holliday junction resolvase-like predicted endonuclease